MPEYIFGFVPVNIFLGVIIVLPMYSSQPNSLAPVGAVSIFFIDVSVVEVSNGYFIRVGVPTDVDRAGLIQASTFILRSSGFGGVVLVSGL